MNIAHLFVCLRPDIHRTHTQAIYSFTP